MYFLLSFHQSTLPNQLLPHHSVNSLHGYKAEKKEEKHLIQTIAATIRTHNYHTTAYINQKYATIL